MFATYRCARTLSYVAGLGLMISPIYGARPSSPSAKPKVLDMKLAVAQIAGASCQPGRQGSSWRSCDRSIPKDSTNRRRTGGRPRSVLACRATLGYLPSRSSQSSIHDASLARQRYPATLQDGIALRDRQCGSRKARFTFTPCGNGTDVLVHESRGNWTRSCRINCSADRVG